MRVLCDRLGGRYEIVISERGYGFDLNVMTLNLEFARTEVGHAYCSHQLNSTLELTDIVIKESSVLFRVPTGLLRFFKKPIPESRCFRQLGLGTELLKFIFAEAKQRGYSRIEGRITSDDFENNSHLPTWYARMGFEVIPEKEPFRVHARIAKDLTLS